MSQLIICCVSLVRLPRVSHPFIGRPTVPSDEMCGPCGLQDQILQMAPLLAPAQADPTCEAASTCERLLRELSQATRAIFHRNPAMR